MKKLFFIGLIALIIFEVLKVYLIMPMPGSQQMDSIDLAYFLHRWRWAVRVLFLLLVVFGIADAFRGKTKWIASALMILVVVVACFFNFQMTAEKMFLQPENLVMKSQSESAVPGSRLILGVEHHGEAKAYPIEYLTYHHQVVDTIGGKPMIITYCSVCRTGRVYEPMVNGQHESFRLVGMDHFNAMFEDATTGSWWRQVTGEAIAGKLKGTQLPEVASVQMTLDSWFAMYPDGTVMQPDEAFIEVYDSLALYEQGKNTGTLTGTDSLSWQNKSWVIGIEVGPNSKAYDWNDLKQERIIHDTLGGKFLLVALSADEQNFVAFERPSNVIFTIDENDRMQSDSTLYDFTGKAIQPDIPSLKRIQAYQEFWHSWQTFHPGTQTYGGSYAENAADSEEQ